MKMFRVVKKRWPVVAAGVILLAAIASLGIVQLQQGQEQNTLNEELARAEQELDELTSPEALAEQEAWQQELDDAMVQSDIAKNQLSQYTDSITANESFFATAAATGVTLTEITVSSETSIDYTGLAFSTFPFTIVAQGEPANLLDFVVMLNNQIGNTLIQTATLKVAGVDADEPSSVRIQLAIYTYRGE